MDVGELKEILNDPRLEDRHPVCAAFPDGLDDETYAAARECEVVDLAGGRRLVLRTVEPDRGFIGGGG